MALVQLWCQLSFLTAYLMEPLKYNIESFKKLSGSMISDLHANWFLKLVKMTSEMREKNSPAAGF